ncbi:MAG: hypothetical protein H0W88_03075 [Parachlamydiaceae bacterium]|nr:hypothetical protein [Parachlamydiaceae bacterium]
MTVSLSKSPSPYLYNEYPQYKNNIKTVTGILIGVPWLTCSIATSAFKNMVSHCRGNPVSSNQSNDNHYFTLCLRKLTEKCVARWSGDRIEIKILFYNNKLTAEVNDKKNKQKLRHEVIVDIWKSVNENITELQKREIVLHNDGTVGFYETYRQWVLKGEEIVLLKYGSNLLARIRKADGLHSNVQKFQSTPEFEQRILDPSCLVFFVGPDKSYHFVLPSDVWKFSDYEVTLLRNDKIVVYNILDKKTNINYQGQKNVPAGMTIEQWVHYLSNCNVIVEGNKVDFLEPSVKWDSGVSLLVDKKGALIWQVFDKDTSLIKQVPYKFTNYTHIIEYLKTDPCNMLRTEKIEKKIPSLKFSGRRERDGALHSKRLIYQKLDVNDKTLFFKEFGIVYGSFSGTQKLYYELQTYGMKNLYTSSYYGESDNTIYSWYLVNLDDEIHLKKKIEFFRNFHVDKDLKLTNITAISRLDNHSRLDKDNWAITLTNTQTGTLDPTTWGGHAQLIIEGVINGEYFLKVADLCGSAATLSAQAGTVRLRDLTSGDLRYVSKTRTWIRKSQNVRNLLEDIEQEYLNLKPVKFSLVGSDSYFTNLLCSSSDIGILQNCITWSREKLESIGIHIDEKQRSGLSFTNSAVLTTPKNYIQSADLQGNEHVYFHFKRSGEIKPIKIDIASEIRKKVGAKSWVLADEQPFGKEVLSVEAIKKMIQVSKKQFLVKIQVNGELKYVDVTQAIIRGVGIRLEHQRGENIRSLIFAP